MVVPTPEEPKLILSGHAFAQAANSCRVRAGTCWAATTATLGRSYIALIQAKSRSG